MAVVSRVLHYGVWLTIVSGVAWPPSDVSADSCTEQSVGEIVSWYATSPGDRLVVVLEVPLSSEVASRGAIEIDTEAIITDSCGGTRHPTGTVVVRSVAVGSLFPEPLSAGIIRVPAYLTAEGAIAIGPCPLLLSEREYTQVCEEIRRRSPRSHIGCATCSAFRADRGVVGISWLLVLSVLLVRRTRTDGRWNQTRTDRR